MGNKQVINNLKRIRDSIKSDEINKLAIEYSLLWISNRANEILTQRVKNPIGTFGANVTSWTIKNYGKIGILENDFDNSASVEFGIGIEGAKDQCNIRIDGSIISYKYNVSSEYKQDDGSWKFVDEFTGKHIGYNDDNRFYGYKGKSFLYDSCMEFIQNGIWKAMYEKAFNKTMERIIKR